jgi:CrcB protein
MSDSALVDARTLPIWQSLALVAVGGAVGAVLRALLSLAASSVGWKGLWGTLAANVIGCLAAGLLLGATRWANDPQHALKFLVMVGVLGGLTTFSALSVETVQLFQQGKQTPALANVGLNLVLGLGAVWLGTKAGVLLR